MLWLLLWLLFVSCCRWEGERGGWGGWGKREWWDGWFCFCFSLLLRKKKSDAVDCYFVVLLLLLSLLCSLLLSLFVLLVVFVYVVGISDVVLVVVVVVVFFCFKMRRREKGGWKAKPPPHKTTKQQNASDKIDCSSYCFSVAVVVIFIVHVYGSFCLNSCCYYLGNTCWVVFWELLFLGDRLVSFLHLLLFRQKKSDEIDCYFVVVAVALVVVRVAGDLCLCCWCFWCCYCCGWLRCRVFVLR